jgi:signal peptidase I
MDKLITKIISKTKNFSLKSQGESMLPILRENDIIYFKKISFSKIKVNDLIIFKNKKKLITHRVIYKTKKYLITKGDNNPNSDGKIYPKKILGRVYQVKRNGQIFKPETLYLIQSTHYFSEIVKIKNEFDKEKINYVFLKGLPLHLYFEGTHPKRLYADCDVLIDKKDFQKVEEILFSFGYQKADTSLSSFQKKLQDKQVENPYFKTINGFTVVFDLHLEVVFMMTQLGKLEALYPQKLIDDLTEEFLKTKRKIKINNEKFLILNTCYLILYLSLHLFHHNFTGAFRYDFLDKVIKKTTRAKEILKRVQDDIYKYRLENFVFPVFFLLKKYYQTPFFINFLKEIQLVNPLTRKLINKSKINIFNDDPRFRAGIKRFLYLFIFSPSPFWKKILIFFNPQVIFAIFWVLIRKIKNSIEIVFLFI